MQVVRIYCHRYFGTSGQMSKRGGIVEVSNASYVKIQGTKNVDTTNKRSTDNKEEQSNVTQTRSGLSIDSSSLTLAGDQGNNLKVLLGQKNAIQVQLDQFKKDLGVDERIEEHLNKQQDYLNEAGINQSESNKLENFKQELKKSYEIDDDSVEQKDLEILEKKVKGKNLTKEESARVATMGPLTEYQQASLDYTKMQVEFQKRADDARNKSVNEAMSVSGIKLSLLKDAPMVDAKEASEKILDKVDEEIQKAIIDELKNKVNENLDIDPNQNILQDPQSLVDNKKVTEEDLKGLAVDEKV